MSDRVQLNLRLDKHPTMYELIKRKAKEEGSSINDWAINVLSRELGLEVDQTPVAQALERISSLEKRMEELESSLLEELSGKLRSYLERGTPPTHLVAQQ